MWQETTLRVSRRSFPKRAKIFSTFEGCAPSVSCGRFGRLRGTRPGPTMVRASHLEAPIAASTTERIFAELEQRGGGGQQAGGAGGLTSLADLRRMDKAWSAVRNMPSGGAAGLVPSVVATSCDPAPFAAEVDIVICGGTLGIFLAAALQTQGCKVAVVERGALRGRAQEWNISRDELQVLADLGVLSRDDLEAAIAVEFNPVRIGFKDSEPIYTRDVLNLGVKPALLIEKAAERFQMAGGLVLSETSVSAVCVHSDGVAVGFGESRPPLVAALLVDCMGHGSPIVRQSRRGEKPDGICCVVGSVASGFTAEQNSSSDLIYTSRDVEESKSIQYFWEAFPAGSGPRDRTTYLFAYLDADPRRPSLESMLEDYWRLMPEYQGIALERLTVQRILFGFFPTYRNSPLKPEFDRVLQVGDASGIQSPLSFGGFGALTRHLPRLVRAIPEAVKVGALRKEDLALINAYNPGISSAWMLQRAMGVRPGERVRPDLINRMLGANFAALNSGGDETMRPFLRDVMRFGPFARTVAGQMIRDPLFVPHIIQHVGMRAMLDWLWHFTRLGIHRVRYMLVRKERAAEPVQTKEQFRRQRSIEAVKYGSGSDHA